MDNPMTLEEKLRRALQGRADRHNQALPPEVRGSQLNQDLDHYLVGNEMAGPQYPLWQRLGAIVPAVGHEIARPIISASPAVESGLNRIFGSEDQPVWIREGAGAGGAAAEPPVSLSGALRNLHMLYKGATEGDLPEEPRNGADMSADKPWEDESLKGAYYAEKKRLAPKKMTPPPAPKKPKTPRLTDALGQAEKLEQRNADVAKKVGGWGRK